MRRFKVTNDCAERAVQMFSVYDRKVTKSETQSQYLLSLIKQQRREKPNPTRKALTENHKRKS